MIAASSSSSLLLYVLAGAFVLGAAWIGAWAIRRTSKDDRRGHDEATAAQAKVTSESATLKAYDRIVGTLQTEVGRLGGEVIDMRAEVTACREDGLGLRHQIETLERALRELQSTVERNGHA